MSNLFPEPQTPQPGPDPGAPKQRWAVCQVFSKRAAQIRSEAEDMGCGGFLPTYKRVHYRDGKQSSSERQLMPGYLFIKLTDDDRSRVAELEGVYRILPGTERTLARLDAELVPIHLGHAKRAWNELEAPPVERRRRHRRRRPRPGRRARAAKRALASGGG